MKRVTVKDIAKQLNIAQGTVSKALGNKSGVSSELRQIILKTADEMGYTANHLAQAMARSPIRIGVVMPKMWANYYGTIMVGIQEQLQAYSDYRFEVIYRHLPTLLGEETLKEAIDFCVAERVEVIILSVSFNSSCVEYLNRLDSLGIKLILVGTDLPGSNRVACVQIDGRKAGMLAGEFANLVMHRSRKAAVFIGNRQMMEHEEKVSGFTRALAGTGCDVLGVYETQDIPEIAEIITRKLIGECPDLEMIYVATSNSVAVCKVLDGCDPACNVRVIATDIFDELIPYVKSGRIVASINQDLRRMGALAVKQSYELFFPNKQKMGSAKIEPILMLKTNMLNQPDLKE